MTDKKFYILGAAVAVLYLGMFGLYFKTSRTSQNDILQQIEQSRKVYTYNIDEIFYAMNIMEAKKNYEESLVKLNGELLETEKKIKSLKDAKVQKDVLQTYLKSLKIKRDEIVGNYEKAVAELSEKMNKALDAVVKEKNVPAIFVQSAIAIKTPDTVDLTQEIIAEMKKL